MAEIKTPRRYGPRPRLTCIYDDLCLKFPDRLREVWRDAYNNENVGRKTDAADSAVLKAFGHYQGVTKTTFQKWRTHRPGFEPEGYKMDKPSLTPDEIVVAVNIFGDNNGWSTKHRVQWACYLCKMFAHDMVHVAQLAGITKQIATDLAFTMHSRTYRDGVHMDITSRLLIDGYRKMKEL